VLQGLSSDAEFLNDDKYLLPVLPDDPLLRMFQRPNFLCSPICLSANGFLLPELDFDSVVPEEEPSLLGSSTKQQPDADPRVHELEERLAASNQAFLDLRSVIQARILGDGGDEDQDDFVKVAPGLVSGGKGKERDDDTHYFASYSQTGQNLSFLF
jgi:hypothetical protein